MYWDMALRGLGVRPMDLVLLTVDDVRERNRRNKKKSLTMYDGITYVELGTYQRALGEITHLFVFMTCAFAKLYGKLQVVEGYGSRVYTH